MTKGAISLAINGTVKQNSDLSKMIWSVAEQIRNCREAFGTQGRRYHLFRHARECRPGRQGRCPPL